MRVYFEAIIHGHDVMVTAYAKDVNQYSEPEDLRIHVVTDDDKKIPLHDFVKDISDFERVCEIAQEELYARKYEGELSLE